LRQLSQQSDLGDEARDLAAFIALALRSIHNGIDSSVSAWEKRGYWVKADRFRMEWAWADSMADRLGEAILRDDWPVVAELSIQTAQRLHSVQVSSNPRLGRPWEGAYARLKAA
jgi:hypothetical protein